MRPPGYAKVGYFPLLDEAAKLAASQVVVDCDPATVSVIDPCIGDGGALKIILDHHGIPYGNVRAVELAKSRGEEAREKLKGCEVLSPACFLSGVNRPERAFTLAYCNPPYASEIGGGYRVETQFLEKLGFMMPVGGVLIMVVPFSTTKRSEFTEELAKKWRRVRIVRVPPEHAPYNETIIVAYRANNKPVFTSNWYNKFAVNYESKELTQAGLDGDDNSEVLTVNTEAYGEPFKVPAARKLCDSLQKTELTAEEIKDRLLESTIEHHVSTPPPIDRGRPPLALTVGHNGILVASGQAPPVVTLRDKLGRMLEVPHLIRGVARKETYIKSIEEEVDDEKDRTTKKTVLSEAVDLKMVVLLHTGEIVNLNEDRDSTAINKPAQSVQILAGQGGSNQGGIGV